MTLCFHVAWPPQHRRWTHLCKPCRLYFSRFLWIWGWWSGRTYSYTRICAKESRNEPTAGSVTCNMVGSLTTSAIAYDTSYTNPGTVFQWITNILSWTWNISMISARIKMVCASFCVLVQVVIKLISTAFDSANYCSFHKVWPIQIECRDEARRQWTRRSFIWAHRGKGKGMVPSRLFGWDSRTSEACQIRE